MIRVLVVEDQLLVREGIQALLEKVEDMEIIGTASNGYEAIQHVQKSPPDVVLMDIHMPKLDGIKATLHLKEHFPNVKVILLTTFAEEDRIITGINVGADGFLLKRLDVNHIVRSIRDAYEGQMVIVGEAARILAKNIRDAKYNKKEVLNRKLQVRYIYLSKRELDVAYALMEEMTNKQMAQKLFLGEGTIKNYISEVYTKLGIRNRNDAIAFLQSLFKMENY
ncbi:response regulator transcription factor [Oceanobacillus halotolerans]|uniref:response regulator transcription factor n=1 Tax=Oceanobacillus halotolerans TaxID=2663380 RepID=UPI0013DD30D2|nr:response regulator transcription factor [Oceanobacillus halotolerans]